VAPAAAAPSGSSSSSSSSAAAPATAALSSSSSSAAAPAAAALGSSSSSSSSSSLSSSAPPFRGPAADSALGERLIYVIGIVAAMGFACEVSHCLNLCGEIWRKGDKGATNDMIARSLERQCGLSAAHAAMRKDSWRPGGGMIRGSTQLIRAAMQNDLPRVLQLAQLGTPIELVDTTLKWSALLWACREGHKAIAKALLDGKYEGCGAAIDREISGWTPLSMACYQGHKGVMRLLLARGARQELQPSEGTALHNAVSRNLSNIVALLSGSPVFAAALALRDRDGRTPLTAAIANGHAACEAVLRAHGAIS